MKDNAKNFALGFLTAILLMLLWRFLTAKKSYYDVPTFKQGMTAEEAQKVFQESLDAINADLEKRSNEAIQAGTPEKAKQYALEAQKAQSDLSMALNTYLVDITPVNAAIPEHPSPAPAPSS
jgi:hypothetical protein